MGERNRTLAAAMRELGLTQEKLAQRMTEELCALTGGQASVSTRNVHNLLAGRVRWPRSRTRKALELVFGCASEDLGFFSPGARTARPQEDPVRRRSFLASATAAAGSPTLTPHDVAMSDVERLRSSLGRLVQLDDEHGGKERLERGAVAIAAQALALQERRASQRVRGALYALAAECTAFAAWVCVDAGLGESAQQHLERAGHLAGLSGDPGVQFYVWNTVALHARVRRSYTDALAAAHAARATGISRKDPLYGSLALARTAIGHSHLRDTRAARRCLDHARAALDRAEDMPRAAWIGFYGPADLAGIHCVVHQTIGLPVDAEYWAHRALAAVPSGYRRNRAFYTTRAAIAQLRQGDVDQSCDTFDGALTFAGTSRATGRLGDLYAEFRADLALVDARPARDLLDRMNRDRVTL